MSPSGEVIKRLVDPGPGPEVPVQTMLAPTRRSLAFLVMTAPLLVEALLPVVAAALTSRALRGSTPLYSRTRRSTKAAAALNLAVTTLAPAEAAAMFLA